MKYLPTPPHEISNPMRIINIPGLKWLSPESQGDRKVSCAVFIYFSALTFLGSFLSAQVFMSLPLTTLNFFKEISSYIYQSNILETCLPRVKIIETAIVNLGGNQYVELLIENYTAQLFFLLLDLCALFFLIKRYIKKDFLKRDRIKIRKMILEKKLIKQNNFSSIFAIIIFLCALFFSLYTCLHPIYTYSATREPLELIRKDLFYFSKSIFLTQCILSVLGLFCFIQYEILTISRQKGDKHV